MKKYTMPEALGKAVKLLRGQKRLTQVQLAEMEPELKQSYLSQVEHGEIFPGKEKWAIIVRALGCSYSELWAIAEDIQNGSDGQSEEQPADYLGCLQHNPIGASYEDVKAIHEAIHGDSTMARIVRVKQKVLAGTMSRHELTELHYWLMKVADTQPESSLRSLAKAFEELFFVTYEKYAITADGRGI